MAITKEKKKEILKELSEVFAKAATMVFVNFHGLSAKNTVLMRKTMKENSVSYKVAKKTLLRKALEGLKIEGELPELAGEIAIAYGQKDNDELALAREIYKFHKTHKENFSIAGGILSGRFQNAIDMATLSAILPKEVLYGQLVNIINWPIQALVMVLDGVARTKESITN